MTRLLLLMLPTLASAACYEPGCDPYQPTGRYGRTLDTQGQAGYPSQQYYERQETQRRIQAERDYYQQEQVNVPHRR